MYSVWIFFRTFQVMILFIFSDYLLSNNHINSIIVHKFDFSDEEVRGIPTFDFFIYLSSYTVNTNIDLNNVEIHTYVICYCVQDYVNRTGLQSILLLCIKNVDKINFYDSWLNRNNKAVNYNCLIHLSRNLYHEQITKWNKYMSELGQEIHM